MGYASTYYSDRRRERAERSKHHFVDLNENVLTPLAQHGIGQWLPFLVDQGVNAGLEKQPGGDYIKGEFTHQWAITVGNIAKMPAGLESNPLYPDAKSHHYEAIFIKWEQTYQAVTAFRGQIMEFTNDLVKKLEDQFGSSLPPVRYGNSNNPPMGAWYEILGAYAYRNLWNATMAGPLSISGARSVGVVPLIILNSSASCALGSPELMGGLQDELRAFLQEQDIKELRKTADDLTRDVRTILGHIAAAQSSRKVRGQCEWV